MNTFDNLCGNGCAAIELPPLDVDQDCIYELHESQFCGLIMTKGQVPEDWGDSAQWETLIANDVSNVDAAKYLVGMGGMPAPAKETRPAPKGRIKTVKRTYTVTFNVHNLADLQYDFLRTLQCGFTDYRFWIETMSGHLFGGPTGILPSQTDADLPLDAAATSYAEGVITLQFDAMTDPPRSAWAAISTAQPSTPTLLAYGPSFNGSEAYGVGTDAYAPA